MAIELQEYVGAEPKEVAAKKHNCFNITEGFANNADCIDENSIMVDIEAIHSVITRNDTLYTEECIKNSIPYWTSPYGIPVIMHHNEKDGVIIGRVKAAKYISNSNRSNTAALELITNIGDENGIKGIKNGTLSTVSIGAIAHDLRCSICGTNLAEEGLCEHEKGEYYNGKKCYWIVNKIEPKEVSYVIVPSDMYAHNVSVYSIKDKKKLNEVNESMSMFDDFIKENGLDVTESAKKSEPVKKNDDAQKEPEKNEEPKVNENKPTANDNNIADEDNKANKDDKANDDNQPAAKVIDVNEEGASKTQTNEDANANKKQDDNKEPENKENDEDNKKSEDDKTLEDLNKKVEELTAEITKLKKENEKLSAKVDSEKALRESAESELISFRTEKKKGLIETINSLRTKLNLPAHNVESLIESSEDILKDNIKNLKEFVEVQGATLAGLQKQVKSPITVSENHDNTHQEKNKAKNVKEAHSDSNIDFEQEIASILNKCF